MYTDLYLKFPDQATAEGVLFDGAGEDDVPHPAYRNIDVIGTIYKDEVALDGYHANVRLAANEDGAALEQYRVFPTTPSRVWA